MKHGCMPSISLLQVPLISLIHLRQSDLQPQEPSLFQSQMIRTTTLLTQSLQTLGTIFLLHSSTQGVMAMLCTTSQLNKRREWLWRIVQASLEKTTLKLGLERLLQILMAGMVISSILESGKATETHTLVNISTSKTSITNRVPRASIADLVVDFPLGQDVGNFQVDRSLNFLSITTSSISTKFVEEYKGQHFCGAGSWFDG